MQECNTVSYNIQPTQELFINKGGIPNSYSENTGLPSLQLAKKVVGTKLINMKRRDRIQYNTRESCIIIVRYGCVLRSLQQQGWYVQQLNKNTGLSSIQLAKKVVGTKPMKEEEEYNTYSIMKVSSIILRNKVQGTYKYAEGSSFIFLHLYHRLP